MLIRTHASGFDHPTSSDITPQGLYWRRREWLQKLAVSGAGTALGAWAARDAQANVARPGKLAPLSAVASEVPGGTAIDALTPYADVTTYNNFYELGTEKTDPSRLASRFKSSPWRLQVDGLVHKPLVLDGADLLKVAPLEERIYRLRCVEGWSMVIPWVGYSLSRLIARAEPMGSAKFVEFITAADPQSMPGLNRGVLNWPYKEGLRMDEALHPLTLLAVGLYGEVLPPQNGAPIRLVVPWKYGFKSGKSLVRIRLVDKQPVSSWEEAAPQEYGFYSNVNPQVAHPRWSQATERRIGEDGLFAKRRKTLMFNGYEAQVGSLYTGMDLRRFF